MIPSSHSTLLTKLTAALQPPHSTPTPSSHLGEADTDAQMQSACRQTTGLQTYSQELCSLTSLHLLDALRVVCIAIAIPH